MKSRCPGSRRDTVRGLPGAAAGFSGAWFGGWSPGCPLPPAHNALRGSGFAQMASVWNLSGKGRSVATGGSGVVYGGSIAPAAAKTVSVFIGTNENETGRSVGQERLAPSFVSDPDIVPFTASDPLRLAVINRVVGASFCRLRFRCSLGLWFRRRRLRCGIIGKQPLRRKQWLWCRPRPLYRAALARQFSRFIGADPNGTGRSVCQERPAPPFVSDNSIVPVVAPGPPRVMVINHASGFSLP